MDESKTALLVTRVERLVERHQAGQLSDEEFEEEYESLSRQLIGDARYEAAQVRRQRRLSDSP